MPELVAGALDSVNEAEQVLAALRRRLRKERLIVLEDAVIAVRRAEGEVEFRQSVGPAGQRAGREA